MSTIGKRRRRTHAFLPHLETDRLHLDAIRKSDRAFLIRIECDAEVMKHVNCGPLSLEQSKGFAEVEIQMEQFRQENSFGRRYGKWVVRDKLKQEPMGWVQTFKYSHGAMGKWLGDFVGVGYEFLPEFWGRGFAPEAVGRVLRHLRGKYPDEPFFAYVREENQRSRRVLEKVGFKALGDRVKDESGTPCPLFILVENDR